jgi:predicted outer membrane lipoprotein
MAAARRAESDSRFVALEEKTERLEWTVSGIKRKVDSMMKGCSLIAEGFGRIETLWVEHIEVAAKNWKGLKEGLPVKLCEDMAEHLQLPYPPAADSEGLQKHLHTFLSAINNTGVIRNVYAQTKWSQAEDMRVRLNGVFCISLNFGNESLRANEALKFLDKALARQSGLRTGDGDVVLPAAGAPALIRRLLYPEKTPEERERANAKGKGKGKGKADGKGKGKGGKKGGKGKKGRGGKGQQNAAAPAAAAPAAPAAGGAAAAAVGPGN